MRLALVSQSPSGSNDFAVKFNTQDSHISQSLTVKGNSVYRIRAMASSSNLDEGNINMEISGAYTQQTFRGIAGSGEWKETRNDFYTSGSAGVNQTLNDFRGTAVKLNKDDLTVANKLLKTLIETIALLQEIEEFDITDEKNHKNANFKSLRWKNKTNQIEKKVTKELDEFLEEDKEEDKENLDSKK